MERKCGSLVKRMGNGGRLLVAQRLTLMLTGCRNLAQLFKLFVSTLPQLEVG